MSSHLMVLVLFAAALAAWVLTWAMRRYALSRQMMDIPNARSSHQQPTPRGGGVAFVITFLCFGFGVFQMGLIRDTSFWAVSGAGAWIALVGFLDDHGHIKARWRLIAHIFAAAWVLWVSHTMPDIVIFDWPIKPKGLLIIGLVLFVVWMLNLYNFMDGIDGLAASQAVFVALFGAILYWLNGYAQAMWMPLLLAASVAGFLIWNFPPAKIFMGDAGSGFLGVVLAIFTLQAAAIDMRFFWAWVILSAVFVVDSTFTLMRRLLSGRKVSEAHRTHAYQYAARRFGSHRTVTLSVWCLNFFWVFPIALLVSLDVISGEFGWLLAYSFLIFLAVYLKAGKAE